MTLFEFVVGVHVFYCVLALAVAHLMRRHATHAGLPMNVRELLTTLAGIQETVLLYPTTSGRPRARRMLTDTTPPNNASTTCSTSPPTPRTANDQRPG